MNPAWPARLSPQDSIWQVNRIRQALDGIAFDLTRPENASIWSVLRGVEPRRSLIELFDMVWWMYFRSIEPVGSPAIPARAQASLQSDPVLRRVKR